MKSLKTVLDELTRLRPPIRMKKLTLLRYISWGLASKPLIKGGAGPGDQSQYPDDMPEELAASHALLSAGLSAKGAKHARRIARHLLKVESKLFEGPLPLHDDNTLKKLLDGDMLAPYHAGFWVRRYLDAQEELYSADTRMEAYRKQRAIEFESGKRCSETPKEYLERRFRALEALLEIAPEIMRRVMLREITPVLCDIARGIDLKEKRERIEEYEKLKRAMERELRKERQKQGTLQDGGKPRKRQ